MTVAHPVLLFAALLFLPLGILAIAREERRRRGDIEHYGELTVLARSSALSGRRRCRWRYGLVLASLSLALVALARPELGTAPSALSRRGRDILVLLDLSRSMNVADVHPSRLAVAKQAARAIFSKLPADRVGLVVFGGSAFLQLPLTLDRSTFELFLDAASTDAVADPSTNLGAAFTAAATLFEHEGLPGTRVVVLLSDGESFRGNEDKALERLRRTGARVFAVGIGTLEGGPVPERADAQPAEYHRDAIGRIARSQLDEESLRRAARATGGAYLRWTGDTSAAALASGIAHLATRELSSRRAQGGADRYQWPLALGLVMLVGAALLNDAWRVREAR